MCGERGFSMNEVITKLDEIEEKADAILSDARTRKEQLMTRLELDKHAVDEQYEQLERETVERLKADRRAEAGQRIKELSEEKERAIQELDVMYADRGEQLADEIFGRVIGTDR
jgi:hypothetical protein